VRDRRRTREHGDDEQAVPDGPHAGRRPARAGRQPREVRRAQRGHERILQPGRRQPAGEDPVDDVGHDAPHRDAPANAAGRRRAPRTTSGTRPRSESLNATPATTNAPAPTSHPARRARGRGPRGDGAQRAQQHQRVVVLAAEAVDEDERVQPGERERPLRRAPSRGASHQTSARHPSDAAAAIVFHAQ
jgi:hypothetical protein